MKTPISVVVDSFNTAEFIGEALESALIQTRPADQIIVSDASTDGSREIIERYAADDARITTVFTDNRGQLATITPGLRAATGDIIFLLDGDDHYAPHHLEELEKRWMRYPQTDAIYCRHRLFGEPALVDFLKSRERHETAEWLGPIDPEELYDWGKSAALAWCHPDYQAGGITSALSFRRTQLESLPLEELCESTNGQLRANAC